MPILFSVVTVWKINAIKGAIFSLHKWALVHKMTVSARTGEKNTRKAKWFREGDKTGSLFIDVTSLSPGSENLQQNVSGHSVFTMDLVCGAGIAQ